MKFFSSPFLVMVVLSCFFSYAQENNIDWILSNMKSFSYESYEILKLYDDLPENLSYTNNSGAEYRTKKSTPTFSYIDNSTKISTLTSMSTNVHEICHGLTSAFFYKEMQENYLPHEFEDITSYFYLSKNNKHVSIFRDKVFPSEELVRKIPLNLRTFRFNTYIQGDSSTQADGIIGLLDEFNAYYHGAKYMFDMLPVYKSIYPKNYLNEWVMNLQSEMTAFYEFDYWIKEYILLAKNQHTQLYNTIMKDGSAFYIYKDIYNNYKDLISKYTSKVNIEKNSTAYNYSSEFWEEDYFRLSRQLSDKKYMLINKMLKK